MDSRKLLIPGGDGLLSGFSGDNPILAAMFDFSSSESGL